MLIDDERDGLSAKGRKKLEWYFYVSREFNFISFLYFWSELRWNLSPARFSFICFALWVILSEIRLWVTPTNRTNPPEAKCSKLAPHALITPRTPRASRVMMLLYACVPHSRVMCNEMELKDLISPLSFAESLWRRLYLDIAVPKPLVLSNYGLN